MSGAQSSLDSPDVLLRPKFGILVCLIRWRFLVLGATWCCGNCCGGARGDHPQYVQGRMNSGAPYTHERQAPPML